jgi:branched-subunit amino acid aminotransferase/4-amino-4-deoxychorismate lyase
MPEPLAFLNGQFLPQSEARLAWHDAGFVFGATVTDFCRTFRHRLYLPDWHFGRLHAGAARIGVAVSLSPRQLATTAEDLVARNAALIAPQEELALISFVTPGPVPYYVGQSGAADSATLGMHTFPLPFLRYAGFFREGAHLVTPLTRSLPGACIDPAIKHRSRLHWWQASRQARQHAPEAIALLLDDKGYVTETALANFLIVQDGTVRTPPSDSVLWGVSVQVVQELCGRLGIPFSQKWLALDDCLTASEAMLCGSAFCLAGVSRINEHAIPWPGPVFERLLAAWSADVGVDIRSQFLAGG